MLPSLLVTLNHSIILSHVNATLIHHNAYYKKWDFTLGSCCGSVGQVVIPDSRDPLFESSRRQTFIEHLFTVNFVEKMKIKKKLPGMVH